MAKLGLEKGVWTTCLGLAGGGAIMIAPAQLWIGYVLLGSAALLFLWGVRINDKHIWQRWWRSGGSAPRRSIAAPIRYNNPATASLPRYDDKHRGPAVADAYNLSDCWIDLMTHSESWPLIDNLPPGMIEAAKTIPEDQRADWLQSLAASDEVDRLISEAMRSGNLPIWVAPIGEPERLVASSAMLEIDHATIASGCYRPPNDRGWLSGRPLFVKRADWAQFVDEVQRSKGAPLSPRGT